MEVDLNMLKKMSTDYAEAKKIAINGTFSPNSQLLNNFLKPPHSICFTIAACNMISAAFISNNYRLQVSRLFFFWHYCSC